MGLIPDGMKAEDLTRPITRAEFAAVSVRAYETLTGTKISPDGIPKLKKRSHHDVGMFSVLSFGAVSDAYPQNRGCPSEQWNACHLIIACGIEDAAVTGSGEIIDARGRAILECVNVGALTLDGVRFRADRETLGEWRENLKLINCHGVTVKDVAFSEN